MIELFIKAIIFYVGVGLLLNSCVTLYLMNYARKEGYSLGVDWAAWFRLSLIWPKTLFKLIEGVFGR